MKLLKMSNWHSNPTSTRSKPSMTKSSRLVLTEREILFYSVIKNMTSWGKEHFNPYGSVHMSSKNPSQKGHMNFRTGKESRSLSPEMGSIRKSIMPSTVLGMCFVILCIYEYFFFFDVIGLFWYLLMYLPHTYLL